MPEQSEYAKAIEERNNYVKSILESTSRKKVVVAGPGTGKTYLFSQLLQGKSKSLVLTFVNSLVEDLSLELYGLADVKTLHSFALSELNRISGRNIQISPVVAATIKEDAEIILNEVINFNTIFYEKEDHNTAIEFYKRRRIYYDYYGYTDIIYGAVKCYEKFHGRIPGYEIILIDEFQDFNKLEVTLIDLLSEKSPILIAGDDDQALYDFKRASNAHIRNRYTNKEYGFDSFTLPSCGRCTRVIVEAINDIILSAQKIGFLKGRIEKPFKYFADQKKDEVSCAYPRIIYSQQFSTKTPWFIEFKTSEFAKEQRKDFSVLIISPYKKQSIQIAEQLRKKGYNNIEVALQDESEITLLDGLKILLVNEKDNLGWRIAAKNLLPFDEFCELLKLSDSKTDSNFVDLLKSEIQKVIKALLLILKKVRDNKSIKPDKVDLLLRKLEFDQIGILKNAIRSEIECAAQKLGIPAIRKIKFKATTIQSSKGLSSDLVFLTHFDDRFIIKDDDKTKILDQEICNFIVALTRARKKIFLISTEKKKPTFLNWINPDKIEIV
jgi:superfamily I DNA/RNA helicase